MITRKELCNMVINNFCLSEKCDRPVESDILKSSKLAVAMEYLGIIKDVELKEYAASRGGMILCGDMQFPRTGDFKIFSMRDLLVILPE